jgi:hypothetical protein
VPGSFLLLSTAGLYPKRSADTLGNQRGEYAGADAFRYLNWNVIRKRDRRDAESLPALVPSNRGP